MNRVGWDPVFEYEGKTFAEMDKDEKVCNRLREEKPLRKAGSWGVYLAIDAEVLPDHLEPDFPSIQGTCEVKAMARGDTSLIFSHLPMTSVAVKGRRGRGSLKRCPFSPSFPHGTLSKHLSNP